MKATIEEECGQRKYPYLGVSTFPAFKGIVVLFRAKDFGVVLKPDDSGNTEVGYESDIIIESQFVPLQGRLILEN